MMLALVGTKPDGTIGTISLHTSASVLYRYLAESVMLELFGVYGDNLYVYEGLGDYPFENGSYPEKPIGIFTISRFTPKPPVLLRDWFDAEREKQMVERAQKLNSGQYGECVWCDELVKVGGDGPLVCSECMDGYGKYVGDE